jgi:hypothetical protein
LRIVSLLASATEIVCALGAGEMLAGRSHECDNPEWVRRLPACSDPAFDVSVSSGEIDREVRRRLHGGEPLYHVHGGLIRELRADLLITQSHCEVCAVTAGVNRDVNVTKRIKTPQGLRYCPVVLSANGRIRPDWVVVNGGKSDILRVPIIWSGGRARKNPASPHAARSTPLVERRLLISY